MHPELPSGGGTSFDDDMMRMFEAGLAKVRLEYQKNLNAVNPLDLEELNSMLDIFSQRLVLFQHEFLEFLAKSRGKVDSDTKEFKVDAPDWNRIPEFVSALATGGTSALLVALIPVATSGWIFTTTVTAAGAVGAAVGVSSGLATAGIGVVGGIVAGLGVAFGMRSYRRKVLRKDLLKSYDEKVAPALRTWARGKLSEQQGKA